MQAALLRFTCRMKSTISHRTVVFRGASGEKYRFQVWPLGTRFKALGAVCLLTRRRHTNPNFTESVSHECLRLGQTSDLSLLAYDSACFKDADSICVYLSQDGEHRSFVTDDLLRGFAPWNTRLYVNLSAPPDAQETGEEPLVSAGDNNASVPARGQSTS